MILEVLINCPAVQAIAAGCGRQSKPGASRRWCLADSFSMLKSHRIYVYLCMYIYIYNVLFFKIVKITMAVNLNIMTLKKKMWKSHGFPRNMIYNPWVHEVSTSTMLVYRRVPRMMISSHILTCFQSSSTDHSMWHMWLTPFRWVNWRLAACRMRVWGWKEQRVAFESICGNWFHVPVSFQATEGYWRHSLM